MYSRPAQGVHDMNEQAECSSISSKEQQGAVGGWSVISECTCEPCSICVCYEGGMHCIALHCDLHCDAPQCTANQLLPVLRYVSKLFCSWDKLVADAIAWASCTPLKSTHKV
jgi:hypothetical protein